MMLLIGREFKGHRVISPFTKGLTSEDSPNSQNRTFDKSVPLERLNGII